MWGGDKLGIQSGELIAAEQNDTRNARLEGIFELPGIEIQTPCNPDHTFGGRRFRWLRHCRWSCMPCCSDLLSCRNHVFKRQRHLSMFTLTPPITTKPLHNQITSKTATTFASAAFCAASLGQPSARLPSPYRFWTRVWSPRPSVMTKPSNLAWSDLRSSGWSTRSTSSRLMPASPINPNNWTYTMSLIKRIGMLGAAVSLCLSASSAFAHATLEVQEAPIKSTYKGVVRIGHGCDGAATLKVRIAFPMASSPSSRCRTRLGSGDSRRAVRQDL